MDFVILGKRIRQRRKALCLTQEELSARAGLSLSFLGHIERGTRKASLESLVALANALSISTDLLLQDSLSDQALLTRPDNSEDAQVLREIHKMLDARAPGWRSGS